MKQEPAFIYLSQEDLQIEIGYSFLSKCDQTYSALCRSHTLGCFMFSICQVVYIHSGPQLR